jgi:hypothetical protein
MPQQEQIAQFDLWVNEAVGNMVSNHAELNFVPSVEKFRDFVRQEVQRRTGGNKAEFCRSVGLKPQAIHGWLNKAERPSLTQFLTLCYGIGVMPTDVFTAASISTVVTEFCLPSGQLKKRKNCSRPDYQRQKEFESVLNAQLISVESLSVNAIAVHLGVSSGCLRYWFPDLCAQLSERYKVAVRNRAEAHQMKQRSRVKDVVKMIIEEGRYPSQRQVEYVLRNEGMTLIKPHMLQAYKEALGDFSNLK